MSTVADPLENELRDLGVEATIERARAGQDRTLVDRYFDLAGRSAQSDIDLAVAALTVCENLAAVWDRSDVAPEVHYLQARMSLMRGRVDEALDLIDQAKSEWLALGRPMEAHRTDLGRMNVLDDLGDHGEAIRTGERLIDNLTHLAPTEPSGSEQLVWLRAAARENLGAAYGYTGRHQQALDAYETAERDYHDVGSPSDVARCRANRGVELISIGRARQGMEAVADAARIFSEVGDTHSHAKCLGHQAEAELLLGYYTRCLDRFVEARQTFENLDARTEAARLAVKTMRAYLALNLIDEAVDIGVTTEEDLRDLGLRHDLAEAQWLSAGALIADGRTEAAIAKLSSSIEGARSSNDHPLEIRARITQSEALSMLGRGADALAAAQSALDVSDQGSWPSEAWEAHLRMSRLVDGDHRADHLARAAELASELGLPYFRYRVLLESGRLCRDRGDQDGARRFFEEAVDNVERRRGFIGDEATRTSFLQGRVSAHNELLSVLTESADGGAHRQAFHVAEGSKARTLTDLMAGSAQARSAVESAPDLLVAEADLAACYNALVTGGQGLSKDHRRAIHERTVELETRIRRSRLERAAGPRATGGSPTDDTATTVPDDDDQVVEFHFIDQRLVAFVWVGGEMTLIRDLPTLDQCRTLVQAWARQLQRFRMASQLPGRPGDNLVASAEETLQRLWAAVFAPLADRLSQGDDLLIIPHGPLNAVPFHALSGPDGRVGQNYPVSMAASHSVADLLRRRSGARERTVGRSVVVGVADEAAPAVATEAKEVAELLDGAELLLGEDGTIEAFTTACRRPVDVAHVACHGLHRVRSPMFSSLKLADGWLTAHDVLATDIDADLVVLSACESGRLNSDRLLNEPVGLARSFLAAGAGAVVVSLWLAHDEATRELMTHFYENLNRGSAPTTALQVARTTVAEIHPHPAAWAPFIIHGGLPAKGER